MLANYFVFVLFYPKSWIVALVTQPHLNDGAIHVTAPANLIV